MTTVSHAGVDRTVVADALKFIEQNKSTGESKLTQRQAEALIAKAATVGDLDADTLAFIESLTSEANAAKLGEVSQKTEFKPDGLIFKGEPVALTPVHSETLDAIAAGYHPSGNPTLDKKVMAADKKIEAILNANPQLSPQKLEQELNKVVADIVQIKGMKSLPEATRKLLDTKLAEVGALMGQALDKMAAGIDPGAKVEDVGKAFAQFDAEFGSFKALAGKLGIDFKAIEKKAKVNIALTVDVAMGKLAERGKALVAGGSVSFLQMRGFAAEERLLYAEAKKYGAEVAEDRGGEVNDVERAVVAKRIETLNKSLQTMLASGKGDIKAMAGLMEEFKDLGGYWNDPVLKPMMAQMQGTFTSLVNDGIASTGLFTDPTKMSADQVKAATGFVAMAAEYKLPIKGPDGKPVSGTDIKAKLETAGMAAVKKDFEQVQSFFLVIAEGLQKGDPESITKGAKLISAILQDPKNPMFGMVTKMLQDPKAQALYNAGLLIANGSTITSVNKAIEKLGITGFNTLTEKVLLSPQNLALPPGERLTVGKLMGAVDMASDKYKQGAGYLHDMAKNKTDHYIVGAAMTMFGAKNPAELTDMAVKMELDASDMEIKLFRALKDGDMATFQSLLVETSEKSAKALQAAKGEWEGDIKKAENIVTWLERVKTASDVVGLALGLPGLVKLGGTMLVRGGAMAIVKNPAAVEWVLATAGKTGLKAAGTEAASLAAKEVLATEGRWAATKVFESAFVKTALPTFAEWGATLSKPFVAASGALFSEVGLFRTIAADVGLGVVQLMHVNKDGGLDISLKDEKGKVKWFDIATTVGGVALSAYGFKASKVKHVEVPEGVKMPEGVKVPEGKPGGVHEGPVPDAAPVDLSKPTDASGKPVDLGAPKEGGQPFELGKGIPEKGPTVKGAPEKGGTATVEKPVEKGGTTTAGKPAETPVKAPEKAPPPAPDATVTPKPVVEPPFSAGKEVYLNDGNGNSLKGTVDGVDAATGQVKVSFTGFDGAPRTLEFKPAQLEAMQKHPTTQWLPSPPLVPGTEVRFADGSKGTIESYRPDGRAYVSMTAADGSSAPGKFMDIPTLMSAQKKPSAEMFAHDFPSGGDKEAWIRTRDAHGNLDPHGQGDLWKVEAYDPKSGLVEVSQTHVSTPVVGKDGKLEDFPHIADPKTLKEGDVVIDRMGKAWKVERSLATNAKIDGANRVVMTRTDIKRVNVNQVVADAAFHAPTVIKGRGPGKETTWKQSLKDDWEVIKAKWRGDTKAVGRVGDKAITMKPAATDPAYTFQMNAPKGTEAALKDPRFEISVDDLNKLPEIKPGQPHPTIKDKTGADYDVISRPDDQLGVWIQKKGAPQAEYVPFADAKEPAQVFKVSVDLGNGKTHEIEVAIALDAKGKPIYSQDDVKKMIADMPKQDIDGLDVLRINGKASRQDAYWKAKGQFGEGQGSAATAGPMSESVATPSGHAGSKPITKTMADGTQKQKKVIDFYPMGTHTAKGKVQKFEDVVDVAHHEMGHLVANKYYGTSVPPKTWEAAIAGDKMKFPSAYGQSNTAEDFAETVRLYMKHNGDASKAPGFGERFKILDDLFKYDGNRAWMNEQFAKSMAKVGVVTFGVAGAGVVTYEVATSDKKEPEKKEPVEAK